MRLTKRENEILGRAVDRLFECESPSDSAGVVTQAIREATEAAEERIAELSSTVTALNDELLAERRKPPAWVEPLAKEWKERAALATKDADSSPFGNPLISAVFEKAVIAMADEMLARAKQGGT